MSKQAEKGQTPAYGSFKTLISFLNDIRESGHVPMQIDRSLMAKLSGSAKGETLATLRFFGLINEKDIPTELFESFTMATDEERKSMLPSIVRSAYSFLFDAQNFHIERATGQQVSDLFRAQGVNGSTLTRAVSLFIAVTKDAGIKISPSIKAPKAASSNGSRQRRDKKPVDDAPPAGARGASDDPPPPGVHRFELPIPGKPSVQVLVPDTMDGEDWDMLSQMFGIYVNRWKGYKNKKETPQ